MGAAASRARTAPHIAPLVRDEEIERIGVQTVIAYEEARGWQVESMESENRGFDLIDNRRDRLGLHFEDRGLQQRRKVQPQRLTDSFLVLLREATTASNKEAIIQGEEFETDEARGMQPGYGKIGKKTIAGLRGMRLGCDHGKDAVSIFVEPPGAEHQRRAAFRFRLIGKGKWHDHDIPWITNHGRPRRPQANPIHQA